MGNIKAKDKDLAMGVSNPSKGKSKAKNLKLPEKKKQDIPKIPNGGSNPCKDMNKKGNEKTKCTYFHKGWHPESYCMNKAIGMMAWLLEKNNILVLEGTRKKDTSSGSDNKEKCHALVSSSSDPSIFIIDLGASRNMASGREFFISMYSNSDPIV